jgi:hypothetical protein
MINIKICPQATSHVMAQPASSAALKAQLRDRFVGQNLKDVPTPSVVLDLAKLEVNCERMLDATERLGLLWRAHIKTHKVATRSYESRPETDACLTDD